MSSIVFFFFNHTATTEIYTLSLHDALPSAATKAPRLSRISRGQNPCDQVNIGLTTAGVLDRKSTRLNSSHSQSSYAVFCLKKKIAASIFFTSSALSFQPTAQSFFFCYY